MDEKEEKNTIEKTVIYNIRLTRTRTRDYSGEKTEQPERTALVPHCA